MPDRTAETIPRRADESAAATRTGAPGPVG